MLRAAPAARPELAPAPAAAQPRRRGLRPRRVLPPVILAVVVLALMVARVLLGTPVVPADQALRVMLGEQIPGISFIVMDNRLPTAVVALLGGAAFGLAGSVFQTLLRNPLASPDVIGVSLGASAAAVVTMAVTGTQGPAMFWAALLGGIATAALTLLVAGAHRPGGAGAVDDRFVLVGIGIAAALTAVVQYLLTRLPSQQAGDVMHWLVGSLNGSVWWRAGVLALALAVLLPVLALLIAKLRVLQLGDETATSLGLPVPATRMALILVSVTLTSLTVAVTGPLAFVAFLSGPIARMIVGRPSIVTAAAVGSLIVLAADLIGQNLFGTVQMPVGVITGALGAPFLLVTLGRRSGAGRGR